MPKHSSIQQAQPADSIEEQTIELDCAPGLPRPGDLFPGVIKGTGLKPSDFNCVSKLFGNWMWVLSNPDKSDLFQKVRYSTIKERVHALYHAGYIRYGSW